MKILFILQYIPYPLNSGGNQATFNMINCVRENHEVSVLIDMDNKDEQALSDLKKIWSDVKFYIFKHQSVLSFKHVSDMENVMPQTFSIRLFDAIRRSMERKINRRIRRRQELVQKSPEEMEGDFIRENSCLFTSQDLLAKDFLEYVYTIARKGFDVIQTEFYELLPLVYILPENVTKVFVHHEIRFIRNKNEMDLFKKIVPSDICRYRGLKALELDSLSCYDKVIVLTDIDKQILLESCPGLDIYVSPAAVSVETVQEKAYKPAKDIVFVGNGYHFPNADALIWFCQCIVPVLKEKGIFSAIYVVGIWGDKIQRKILQVNPDVHFTGFVDDLSEFLNGKISIVPIRIGSGMRMKILESVAAGSPIITTSKGCEGLPLKTQKDCFIADTVEDFASAIEVMITHEDIQRQYANQAKKTLSSGHMSREEALENRLNFYKSLEKEI